MTEAAHMCQADLLTVAELIAAAINGQPVPQWFHDTAEAHAGHTPQPDDWRGMHAQVWRELRHRADGKRRATENGHPL